MKELRTLTLWNVRQFPESLEAFEFLEFFTDCGTPGLRELPPGFTRLRKLRMARLFQNRIEVLPDDIGDLAALEQLSLYQNHLRSLPDSFGRLAKLEKLNLGWNRLEAFPPCLARLAGLRWLGMFENPLSGDRPSLRDGTRVDWEWPFSSQERTS